MSNDINGMRYQILIQATSDLNYPLMQTDLANYSAFPVAGSDVIFNSASTRGVENPLEK